MNDASLWTTKIHFIKEMTLYNNMGRGEEEDDFTSSANQRGCTDVPGLSVTWSKTSFVLITKANCCMPQIKFHQSILFQSHRCVVRGVAGALLVVASLAALHGAYIAFAFKVGPPYQAFKEWQRPCPAGKCASYNSGTPST